MQSLVNIIKLQLYSAFADAANLLIFAQLQLSVRSQKSTQSVLKQIYSVILIH
jgi:hypothetical protein